MKKPKRDQSTYEEFVEYWAALPAARKREFIDAVYYSDQVQAYKKCKAGNSNEAQ